MTLITFVLQYQDYLSLAVRTEVVKELTTKGQLKWHQCRNFLCDIGGNNFWAAFIYLELHYLKFHVTFTK